MNLIEQLDGYEAAKGFYERVIKHGFELIEVRDALLEYRREHNIFEVGDKVVFNSDKSDDLDLYIVDAVLDGGSFLGVNEYRQAFPSIRFRHATPEEIATRKRQN